MAVDPKKQAYWTEQQQAWKGSGLSQRAYCQREGLSFATFTYWRSLARDGEAIKAQQAQLKLVPVHVAGSAAPNVATATLRPMTLQSPGGWQLGFSSATELAALLPLLRQIP